MRDGVLIQRLKDAQHEAAFNRFASPQDRSQFEYGAGHGFILGLQAAIDLIVEMHQEERTKEF